MLSGNMRKKGAMRLVSKNSRTLLEGPAVFVAEKICFIAGFLRY
jgi:hypothetical protein